MVLCEKVPEVVLLGVNSLSSQFIQLLKKENVKIKALIDPSNNIHEHENFKVISTEQYLSRPKEFSKIPLVTTESVNGSIGQFMEMLSPIINYPGLGNIKVLHPSFLTDSLDLNFINKALIIGCNRSGSTLLFSIVKKILETRNEASQGSLEVLCEDLARDHFDLTLNILDNAFYNENSHYTATGATSYGFIDYFGCKDEAFYFLNSVRSNRFIFDRVHRTYSKLDKSILRRMASMGYVVFTPIRNPLDIILSNAFELEYVIIQMNPKEKFDRVESDFREKFGVHNLTDLNWFTTMAQYVKDYFESVLNNGDETCPIKYEDLITMPEKTINKIARNLEFDLNENEVRDLWTEVGFKPLAAFKSHLFRPGAGKWRDYFTLEHIGIIKSLGYEKLLRDLGYDLELVSDKKLKDYDKIEKSEEMEFYLSVRDYIMFITLGKQLSFKHDEILFSNTSRARLNLNFVTNDTSFMKAFNKLLFSNVFFQLSSSLDI